GAGEVGELESGFNRMAESIERHRDQLEDHQAEVEAQRDELEAALASVEERNEWIEGLRRFGDRLADQESVEGVAGATLSGIADAGACEIGAAYMFDSDTDVFLPVAWRGLDPADLPAGIKPGEGLAGRALDERRKVSVAAPENAMRTTGLAGRLSAAHELHIPILHRKRTIRM